MVFAFFYSSPRPLLVLSSSTRAIWATRIDDKHFYVYSAGTYFGKGPDQRVMEDLRQFCFCCCLPLRNNKGQCHRLSQVKPIGQHQIAVWRMVVASGVCPLRFLFILRDPNRHYQQQQQKQKRQKQRRSSGRITTSFV